MFIRRGLDLSVEQRQELKRLRTAEGLTYNQARYRVYTPDQLEIFKQATRESKHRRSIENPRKWMLSRVERSARHRGIEFSITEADLDWPTHCPVLGWELLYRIEPEVIIGSRRGAAPNAAAIDRIFNSRGYVPGNVIIVSYWVNIRKGDATADHLRAIADFYGRLEQSCCVEPWMA